jgi:hypothetical protein
VASRAKVQLADSLHLRGDVGIISDFSLFVEASLVVADRHTLAFDRGDNCAAGECVETLIRDGIVPGDPSTSWGLDAESGKPFSKPSDQVFAGPKRFAGLAQSELWEVLSGDSRCSPTATAYCRAGIDVDAKGAPAPNSGVLRSPGYGAAGFSALVVGHAQLRGLFGMLFE